MKQTVKGAIPVVYFGPVVVYANTSHLLSVIAVPQGTVATTSQLRAQRHFIMVTGAPTVDERGGDGGDHAAPSDRAPTLRAVVEEYRQLASKKRRRA